MKTRLGMPALFAATIIFTSTASIAEAKCVPPSAQSRGQYQSHKKMRFADFVAQSAKGTKTPSAEGAPAAAEPSMVGLWLSGTVIEGEVYFHAFDLWNADGTEVLNDQSPILAGNVCLGVWEKTAPLTYSLKHPSWIYDEQGVEVIGIAWLLENISLDPGGDTYTGDLNVKITDFEGTVLDSLDFKIVGKRIKAGDSTLGG